MKWYFTSLGIFLFLSCQIDDHSGKTHSDPNSQKISLSGSHSLIDEIAYDIPVDPIRMPYRGEIRQTASWQDKNGKNTLIISGIHANGILNKAEIFTYNYIEKDSLLKTLWKSEDHVMGSCESDIFIAPETLEVLDINQDGIAESVFMYILSENCDASPVRTKLMMHSGEKELMIEGLTKVFLLPIPEVEENSKRIDKAFQAVDPLLRTYASQKWDNYVREETLAFQEAVGN